MIQPEILNKIEQHYKHAKEKHPYFCDEIISEHSANWWSEKLYSIRHFLREEIAKGKASAETILLCEIAEVFSALENDSIEDALYECDDAIAVLLRIKDVLEGRQALGDPEKKGANDEQ